ncbi:MAG: hypothetical protein HFG70_02805 [Hungatella sp.]|nr:hypothetical protein [Hungatella sp.]
MRQQIAGAFFALLIAAAGTVTAWAADEGVWELSEDGKYWMYMYGPDDPAEDEWIEDSGKIYYVDAKGRMKTGWVASKSDGQKYYMGPDGAMCFNTFASDGRYVGSEGTGVEAYDKYRKAVKSQIKKAAPKKTSGKKNVSSAQEQLQQFFKLEDLNMDGYQDLIIMWGAAEARSLCQVAVWIPEDGKFQLSAEFDMPDNDGSQSALYLDPEGEEVWLEMLERSGDMNLFQMKYISPVFDNIWSFTVELDEAGEGRYYVNGMEESREDWELFMIQARQERGSQMVTGYLPATEENINQQVDRVLTEEGRELWE